MKTLDEVIDLFDKGCIRPCVECPCYGMKECKEHLAAESYYLHKYQEIEDEYEELKDWFAEEHAENVPLTWNELKTMEGKPVWVETKYYSSRWVVITDVDDVRICFVGKQLLDSEIVQEMGKTWNAFRKERE